MLKTVDIALLMEKREQREKELALIIPFLQVALSVVKSNVGKKFDKNIVNKIVKAVPAVCKDRIYYTGNVYNSKDRPLKRLSFRYTDNWREYEELCIYTGYAENDDLIGDEIIKDFQRKLDSRKNEFDSRFDDLQAFANDFNQIVGDFNKRMELFYNVVKQYDEDNKTHFENRLKLEV